MKPRRQPSTAGIAAAAIVVLGLAAAAAIAWPGYLSYDSVLQLLQGRTGAYNTWHPPIMAWMLGVGDAALPGAGLFVLFDAGLLCAAMVSLLWLRPRASWAAVFVGGLCVLSPQFLIYQGIVWKDVLFADAAVAGFAMLACAAARWRDAGMRFVFIGVAIVLLTLAALTRQNGAIVIVFGAIALAAIAWRDERRAAVLYGAGALLVSASLFIAASLALETRGDGGYGRLSQVKALELYDIAGMVAAKPGLPLKLLNRPVLENLIRSDGAQLYTPQQYDTLAASPALQAALVVTPERRLLDEWFYLVRNNFGLYLRTRAAAFRWVTLTPDIRKCHPYYVGVSGPPDVLRKLGLNDQPRPRDRTLSNYGGWFVGTPVFSHVTFGIIAIIALLILFRRREPADIVMGCMLLSAFAFALSFFFISVACDYRYLYYLDLSALVACFYIALKPISPSSRA
jgi:hypothetical protein